MKAIGKVKVKVKVKVTKETVKKQFKWNARLFLETK